MKIKDGFILRTVAGNNVAVPIGAQSVNFNCIITLNDTAKFLWTLLEQETDEAALADALVEKYEITLETAANSVSNFIQTLKDNNLLA